VAIGAVELQLVTSGRWTVTAGAAGFESRRPRHLINTIAGRPFVSVAHTLHNWITELGRKRHQLPPFESLAIPSGAPTIRRHAPRRYDAQPRRDRAHRPKKLLMPWRAAWGA